MVEDVTLNNFSNVDICGTGSIKNYVGMQIDIEIDNSDGKKWFFNPQVSFSYGAYVSSATFKDDGSEDTATKVLDVAEAVDVQDGKKAGALDFNVTISKKTVIHI